MNILVEKLFKDFQCHDSLCNYYHLDVVCRDFELSLLTVGEV